MARTLTDRDVAALDAIISIEELATICEVSSRHLRRILDERRVARAAHGMVKLAAGMSAFLRHGELIQAREIAARWVDDPEMQRFLTSCLIARWRGFESEITAFANWSEGPPPRLAPQPEVCLQAPKKS